MAAENAGNRAEVSSDSPALRLIKRRRLSDEVLAEFERLIVSGAYAPGDLLPSERELMERFGVGRPAIREALFALQKNGLVALAGGARARVTEPSAARVISELAGAARYFLSTEEGERAFQDARLFFEVGLVRHAALHATDDEIARLEKALKDNEEAIGDVDAFQRTDVAFHLQLALISKNPIFKAIHDAIEAWLLQQRKVTLMIPGALREAHQYHRRIYEAIAARDPDRAAEAMRSHLESVADFYWRARRSVS